MMDLPMRDMLMFAFGLVGIAYCIMLAAGICWLVLKLLGVWWEG